MSGHNTAGGFRRFQVWLGHADFRIWCWAVPVLLASEIVHTGWLDIAGTVSAAVFACAGVESYLQHHRRLCERCAEDVPLNGPERAAQRTRTLRLYHRLAKRTVLAAPLVVVIAARVVDKTTVLPIAALLVFAFITVFSYAGKVHKPLQPWCRDCHWGDGGEPERVDDPVPTGSGVLTS